MSNIESMGYPALLISLVEKTKTDASHTVSLKTRLLEDAGIDSLGLIDLIEQLQRETGVTFRPEDYSPENFESVTSILELLHVRR